MAGGERLLARRPRGPNRIERQVKNFPREAADENDGEIDPVGSIK